MIIDRITFARLKERLAFLSDPVLSNIRGKDMQNVEIRRAKYEIEGGGVMYMVMPEGQVRPDTPRLKGFTEARAEA